MVMFSFLMLKTKIDEVNQERRSQTASFSQSVDRWEKEFSSIFNVAQSIRSLPSFDRFALCQPTDYYNCLSELFRDLSRFNRIVTDERYSLMVHRLGDDTVITNSGTRGRDYVLTEMGLDPETYEQITKKALEQSLYPENYIFTDEILLYIYIVDYVDEQIVISLYTPMEKLEAYAPDENRPLYLMVDDDKITDSRSESFLPDGVTEIDFDGIKIHEPGIYEIGGRDYVFTSSAYVNLYYGMQLPVLEWADVLVFMLQIGLGFFVISAVSYTIVRTVSTRLYRPIERLVDTLMEFSSENESPENENEIDFMARQVAQIRSRNRELSKKLEMRNLQIRERSLKQLLKGNLSSKDWEVISGQLGLDWLDEPLTLVLFEFVNMNALQSDAAESTLEDLAHLLEESMRDKVDCLYVQPDLSTLCFFVRTVDEDSLHATLSASINLIDTAFNLPVYAFISKPCESTSEMPNAFLEMSYLRDNRTHLPVKNIYRATDLERIPQGSTIYPISLENALLEATINGNMCEVSRHIDAIFTDYVEECFHDFNQRDMIVFALTNTINRAVEYSSMPFSALSSQGKYVFLELRSCESARDLKRYVSKRFSDMVTEVNACESKKSRDLRDALKEYIAGNYQRDISLLDMAEEFALSPNYMSAVFKSTIGDNFKEYLSRVRFEQAVELLRQDPDIKLTILGTQVGISNVNTLIRIFKKYSGLAPGQYARKHFPQE